MILEKPSYDLTTEQGMKEAAAALGKDYLPWFFLGGPVVAGMKMLFDKVFEPSPEIVAAQAQAVKDIIKAGAEDGSVSELDITLSQEAGAHFGAEYEGVPIKFTLGKSGTIKMNVKYKEQPRQA